jgi:Peptidase family M23/Alpha/beta hydrolase of unknown function (DUF915)
MRPLSAPRATRVVLAATVAFVASSVVDRPLAAQEAAWIPPVDGAVMRAFVAPIAEYATGHRGVDFAAAAGTTVRASNDGTVSFAGDVAGALHVVVAHEGGIRTSYSFLASADVQVGQHVSRGQVIGRAGGTGDGHGAGVLHFGVRIGDRYVDPMLLFRPRDLTQIVRLVPPEELEAAARSTPEQERRELARQVIEEFGSSCVICGPTDWLGDRAEEAFDEGSDAFEAAAGPLSRWGERAIDAARHAMELAIETAGAVRDQILTSPFGLMAQDLVTAGGVLLGWFGRECDDDAPPANGHGGSGNVMYAVGGIDSHKDSPEGRSFNLPAGLLGFDTSERYWFSYRAGSKIYRKRDTYQDLRKSARLLANQLREAAKREPGRKFDLVGHSQGGVVIALFLVDFYAGHEDEYPPIDNVVTFASPLSGTPFGTSESALSANPAGAALLHALSAADESTDLGIPDPTSTAVQQLAEDSALMRHLRASEVPERVNFTSISGVYDWQVPSLATRFSGAQRHDIDAGVGSHAAITHDPRALMAARAALEKRSMPCTSFEETLAASAGSFLLSSAERLPATLP